MKTAIGHIPMYNIIIIFIVITFGFLSATLSYSKAFKVNSKIANSLEKFEGSNSLAINEIEESLTSLGYRVGKVNCKDTFRGRTITYQSNLHKYCLYKSELSKGYFTYGIVTYIFLDIPVFGGTLKLPVYSETDSIFKFSSDKF